MITNKRTDVHTSLARLINVGRISAPDGQHLVKLPLDRQAELAKKIDTITYKQYKAILSEAKRL